MHSPNGFFELELVHEETLITDQMTHLFFFVANSTIATNQSRWLLFTAWPTGKLGRIAVESALEKTDQ